MANSAHDAQPGKMSVSSRWLRLFQPSHQHTAFSATVLLMTAMVLSRIVGYVREAYTAWAFGAGPTTDAYIAAFQIPDFLAYLVAGGTISITFVSIYTRFLAEKREEAVGVQAAGSASRASRHQQAHSRREREDRGDKLPMIKGSRLAEISVW